MNFQNRNIFKFSQRHKHLSPHKFPEVKFNAAGERVFTRQEVARHNSFTDAWLVINKGVYNVTEWLPYHPGGEGKIQPWIGKDATVAFDERGHSSKAREVLEDFKIGVTEENRRFMCNNTEFDIVKELGVGPSKHDWKKGWHTDIDYVT